MAQEKQRYLRQVEDFCTQVKNDWYRVYLVRKLTSQRGMEFVQSLSRQGHPAHWIFPPQVLALQVRCAGSRGRCRPSSGTPPTPTSGFCCPSAARP